METEREQIGEGMWDPRFDPTAEEEVGQTRLSTIGPAPMISEADLARRMGLAREVLVVFRQRHLSPGVDFCKIKRKVHLAQGAVERVLGHFAGPDPQIEKNGHGDAPGAAIEPVLLVVLRGARNEKILFAKKKEGDGGEVRVRVRSNANFLAGMEIRGTPHPEYDDFYELVGRCPRQRGRW